MYVQDVTTVVNALRSVAEQYTSRSKQDVQEVRSLQDAAVMEQARYRACVAVAVAVAKRLCGCGYVLLAMCLCGRRLNVPLPVPCWAIGYAGVVAEGRAPRQVWSGGVPL